MGYDLCLKCLKYTVFTVNFIFWIFGLAVLGLAIYLRLDSNTNSIVSAGDNLEKLYIGIYILMGAGALMTLVGFVGCCGAYQESQCLLSMFFLFLLLIFGAEVGGATWAYTHKMQLRGFVDQSLKDLVQHEYGVNTAKTIAYDFIQRTFMCCGGESPYDWSGSLYATRQKSSTKPDPSATDITTVTKVPPSCCTMDAYDRFGQYCGDSNYTNVVTLEKTPPKIITIDGQTSIVVNNNNNISNQNPSFSQEPSFGNAIDAISSPIVMNNMIYQKGCSDALEEYFKSNLDIIIGVALAVIILQLMGLLLSIILCCYIRRTELDMDDYK